jgi:hypothetical protein
MKMSYFSMMTKREVTRMSALKQNYEEQLADLPKGTIRKKERNGRIYFYLAYRAEGKVVSEYIGNDESALGELRERLERRKNIEALLKSINNELRLMNRALEVAR